MVVAAAATGVGAASAGAVDPPRPILLKFPLAASKEVEAEEARPSMQLLPLFFAGVTNVRRLLVAEAAVEVAADAP